MDQMLEQYDKAERGIREKDELTRQAREENRVLTSDLAFKEQELKRIQEELEAKDKQMLTVTAR